MRRKYRVTPRGKVVFSSAAIIFLVLVFMLIQSMNADVIPSGNPSQSSDAVNQEAVEAVENNVDTENTATQKDAAAQIEGEQDDNELSVADEVNTTENANLETGQDEAVTDPDAEDDNTSEEAKAKQLYEAMVTVYFDPDKYDLNDEYKLVLNVFINTALMYPEEPIKIEGNINGYPKFNDSKFGEELSQIRANKVAQYLMNRGIPEELITVQSNGSAKPLNKSDAPEELMKNRRTEVYFESYYNNPAGENKEVQETGQ